MSDLFPDGWSVAETLMKPEVTAMYQMAMTMPPYE